MSESALSRCTFSVVRGSQVSQELLDECAQFFSANYGVWSPDVSAPLKPGEMTPAKLRSECFTDPDATSLALCRIGNDIVGYAFATVWEYEVGKNVCWVTQLVVSSQYRRQNIATLLLTPAPPIPCHAFGIASSHPGAVAALTSAADAPLRKVDLNFIKDTANRILATTPVPYLRAAQSRGLRGALFGNNKADGGVCSVFTDFFVDHEEPRAALEIWENVQDMKWPLGKLAAGHGICALFPFRPSS
ncbi:hypothetical protein B0H14DRAFT_2405966 [Mycena olivaceomarginata]|nr:hypothetical protein B0H14DRAFT_2405966 [Mycena olivaceomarginata]